MRWNIGQAKQRFSEVVRRAATEPQLICNRNRVVAAVVDAESAERLQVLRRSRSRKSIAAAFEGLRDLTRRQGYRLKTPARTTRRNAFADGLARIPR
jgi:prevent-host-death family protein